MTRFCLIGPTYPYRGGIAHYTTLLANHLREEHQVLMISFSRQYPKWLFPGRTDRDPSQHPIKTSDVEYILDALNPVSWWRTLRHIDAWQADVVIIPWWVPFWAPAWAVLGRGIKRLRNKPRLIFVCHNVLPHERGKLTSLLMPLLLRLALLPGDNYLVHSEADRRILAGYFPRATIQVTPHPTYAEIGAAANGELPVELPANLPILLFCGFVRPYKGLDILLDALPIVLEKHKLHLLVAGEFWQDSVDQYREQIERLNLSEAVTIIDEYLPNEILSACITRADVVVLPYRSATQSGIIQAAFGLGKPVITTNVGGLAEVVKDGQTGLVVPPEDPQALAAAITQFCAEGAGATYAKNIRFERERFSWERFIDKALLTGTKTKDQMSHP